MSVRNSSYNFPSKSRRPFVKIKLAKRLWQFQPNARSLPSFAIWQIPHNRLIRYNQISR
jgi:hypothetical protein